MHLSVVIVSHSTRALLLECLEAVAEARTAFDGETEVFVVDNASRDGSADAVRAAFPSVTVVENAHNAGFAAANNVALKKVSGRYALLLNPDTRVPTYLFAPLLRVMDEKPRVAVCAPLLLNADGTPQPNWACFQNALSELTGRLNRSQSPYPLSFFDDRTGRSSMRPFPVDWIGGACLLVRGEAAHAVGYLDEAFFLYGEDEEWCYRFACAGWQTLLVPSVSVTHLGGQSAATLPQDETRERLYRSTLLLYRKLHGAGGAVLPSLLAAARFGLFRMRNRLRAGG